MKLEGLSSFPFLHERVLSWQSILMTTNLSQSSINERNKNFISSTKNFLQNLGSWLLLIWLLYYYHSYFTEILMESMSYFYQTINISFNKGNNISYQIRDPLDTSCQGAISMIGVNIDCHYNSRKWRNGKGDNPSSFILYSLTVWYNLLFPYFISLHPFRINILNDFHILLTNNNQSEINTISMNLNSSILRLIKKTKWKSFEKLYSTRK
jgi:hypothetical protein